MKRLLGFSGYNFNKSMFTELLLNDTSFSIHANNVHVVVLYKVSYGLAHNMLYFYLRKIEYMPEMGIL